MHQTMRAEYNTIIALRGRELIIRIYQLVVVVQAQMGLEYFRAWSQFPNEISQRKTLLGSTFSASMNKS